MADLSDIMKRLGAQLAQSTADYFNTIKTPAHVQAIGQAITPVGHGASQVKQKQRQEEYDTLLNVQQGSLQHLVEGLQDKQTGKKPSGFMETTMAAFSNPQQLQKLGKDIQSYGDTAGKRVAGIGLGVAGKGIEGLQYNIQSSDQLASASGGVGGAGKAVGGAIAGAGGMLQQINSPYAQVAGKGIESLGKFVETITGAIDKVKAFADGMHKANMMFAEFSGAMAGVKARSDVRDIRYSMGRGDARASSAENLSQARDRLRRATAPVEDMWSNIKNDLMSWGLNALTGVVIKTYEAVSWLAKKLTFGFADLGDIKEMMKKEEMVSGPVKWLDDAEKLSKAYTEYGVPKDF